MRFLFYSHDGLGLGHTRRHIAVASALVEMAPGSSVLLATGAEVVAEYDRVLGFPIQADFVPKPGVLDAGSSFYLRNAGP